MITVEEAIFKGKKRINKVVSYIQMILLFAWSFLFFMYGLPWYVLLIIIPSIVITPWIYWSFAITRWRLWAFENVKDVQQLKLAAQDAKLIWPDGHLFEKTEFRSAADKERLKIINERLER